MTQRESLDAELLCYTDCSPKDDRLIQALGNFADCPTDKLRIDRLLRVIRAHVEPWLMTRISSALKQHTDLGEALNLTYLWMLNTDPETGLPRILSFETWAASCTQESFANWLYNKSLCYRLEDLRVAPIDQEKRFRKGSRNNPQALDSSAGVFGDQNYPTTKELTTLALSLDLVGFIQQHYEKILISVQLGKD